jgi:uncharacterized protein
LYSQGHLRATVDYECSRCLTDFDQPVSVRLAELYHYPPESAPPDAPTIGDDVHLDLTQWSAKTFLVSIPIRALCRPDCKACARSAAPIGTKVRAIAGTTKIDPRLAVLADLFKKQDPGQETPGQ